MFEGGTKKIKEAPAAAAQVAICYRDRDGTRGTGRERTRTGVKKRGWGKESA